MPINGTRQWQCQEDICFALSLLWVDVLVDMRINGADQETSIGQRVNILTGDVTLQFII